MFAFEFGDLLGRRFIYLFIYLWRAQQTPSHGTDCAGCGETVTI